MALAAKGLTGPEFAGELGVTTSTVNTHFRHIYEKLGVRTRAGGVATSMRLRLIIDPGVPGLDHLGLTGETRTERDRRIRTSATPCWRSRGGCVETSIARRRPGARNLLLMTQTAVSG